MDGLSNTLQEYSKISFDATSFNAAQLKTIGDIKPKDFDVFAKKIQGTKTWSDALLAEYGESLNPDIGQYQEYATLLEKLTPAQQALMLSTQGLTNEQIMNTLALQTNKTTNEALTLAEQYQALADAGLLASKRNVTAAIMEQTLQTVLGEDADTAAIMTKLQLKTATDAEGNATVQLTEKKLAAAVADGTLTTAEATEIASILGVSAAINIQTTTTMPKWIAMIYASTKAIWEQVVATKAWIMGSPVGMLVGVSAALGAGVLAYSAYQKSVEKAREATQANADAYSEESSSIDGYISKYNELHSELIAAQGDEEETYKIKQELFDLQKELNDKYGEEAGKIDLVTDAYKDQTDALRKLNKEQAAKFLNDSENRASFDRAENNMIKKRSYNLSGSLYDGLESSNTLKEIAQKYEQQGVKINPGAEGEFQIRIEGVNAEEAYQTINDFITDVRHKAKELGNEHLFDNVLNISGSAYDNAKSVVDDWGDIFKKKKLAEIADDDSLASDMETATKAVKEYNDAVLKASDPMEDTNVAKAFEKMNEQKQKMLNSSDWDKYKSVINDTFAEADTSAYEFYQRLKSDDSLSTVAKQLTGMTDTEVQALIDAGTHVDDLTVKYEKAVEKRKELYSGSGYVGNVDINNRPVVINDDGSYSTTSTAMDYKWVGDEETGQYKIIHYTPILPDGTILEGDALEEYINRILDSSDSLAADNPKNGGLGIVYKVDFEVNGKKIDDGNIEEALKQGDDWDVQMHLTQDSMYSNEAKLKQQLEQQNAIDVLKKSADEANVDISKVIAQLVKLGVVSSGIENKTEDAMKPLSKTDMISELNGLSEGFEELDKIMSSMSDKDKAFDFALLDDKKFKDTFGTLGKEYENFVEKISNSPKDVNACQSAFDELVTKWIQTQGVLDKVTEDTAGLTEAMLTNMGVANASDVVSDALERNAAKADAAAIEQQYLADTGKDLTAQNWDTIASFASQNQASQLAQQELAKLKLAKLDLNNNPINLDTDISEVLTLAKAANVTASKLRTLSVMNNLQTKIQNGENVKGNSYLYDRLAEGLNDDTSWIKGEDIKFEPIHYTGGNKTANTGSKNSKGDKSSKEPTEFDWIERKLDTINNRIDQTKSNIEQLVGYKDKNAETDTALDLMAQKLGILQQMSDAYMKSANEIGLSEDYINRIKNGDDFVEEIGDKDIADKVKKYQDLYDKAQDCTKQISDLNKEIKGTGLTKLDNIVNQYEQLNDVLSKPLDTQLKLLDWHKASGTMEVVADDYISLGETQKKIAQNAREEYDKLAEEMKKLNLKKGSDEWKTYNDKLIDCKNAMIEAAKAVEDYKDQMKELVYKELTDYKSKMDSINNTISTMSDLIGDTKLVDETGKLTDRGLAQMALYAQQLANAKQEAAEYDEAIKSLADALDSGLITQDEYNDMLSDYRSSQESAVSATKDARDAIISLAKEGIQAEIDARKEQTDAAIEALDAEKDLHDYTESINEKQKNITTLQKKIAALSGATSGAELAQRLQLEKDLADAQKDLYNTQYDHNREEQKKMLNDAYDAYEKEKNDEMDELDSNLAAQEKAINKYLSEVKANYKTAYKVLNQYGDEYNLSATEDLTTPWESGSSAANLCADAIGDAVANINYEISNIDISPLEELISAMQQLADYGISGSGDGTQSFKDVTGEGKWHKGSGGRYWYGNSNEDYVSGGIYTIEGQQYGFGDDGYMFEGWNNEYDGNWRYFQKKDGYMVKSDWVQDKGKWYYLDKNGAMLTDSVVKDKNDSNKYYYVDDNGVYDGKELTYDQVKAMGLKVGYRKGTKSADKGWHAEGEDGYELIEADDGTMLRNYHGGETVFTKAMTDNLWNFSKNPNMFVDDLKSSLATDVPMINNSMAQNININIPIAGNADMNTVNAIKEMLPKEMKKYATGKMWSDISATGIRYRR